MINRTGLVSERHSMQIDGIIATENATQSAVIATLDNSVFTEGFYYRELALFAKDPDTDQEGVYLYDNAGQECEFLGLREDGVVIYERIKMLIRVEQTSQISFDGSGNPLYMSPEDVIELIEQHNVSEDAHKTKADLGKDGLLKDSQRPKADGLYMPDGKKISDKINGIEAAMLLALAAAAPYSTSQTYALGAYCTRIGKLYKCTTAITSAEDWTAAHWTETTMGAELVAIYTTLANKAPGGFGLGENPVWGADADLCVLSGWYVIGSNVPLPGAWVMRVDAAPNSVYQTAYARKTNSGVPDYVICRRYKAAGSDIFSTWEYINPPMLLGVEYRTTERYLGKPVYVKVVDCGVLPDGTNKVVSHGITDIAEFVRFSGIASNSTSGFNGRYPMPSIHNNSLSDRWTNYVVDITNNDIALFCGGGSANCLAYVTLYYTKTTD